MGGRQCEHGITGGECFTCAGPSSNPREQHWNGVCETVTIWPDGRGPYAVDACIETIVRALNAGGVKTIASCCGHGARPGNVALADGRELIIAPNYEAAREIDNQLNRHGALPIADSQISECGA